MTVGSGLFAATCLAVLYLTVHHVTVAKRWRLVGKIIAGFFAAVVVVGFGAWQWSKYQNRPRPVDELDDVRLGMSPLDVKLAKGLPGAGVNATPEKTSKGFSLAWVYGDDPTLLVGFTGKTAKDVTVAFVCESGGYSTRLGLGRFSTEEQIRGALGSPTKVSIRNDGLAKTISYERWHLGFEFEKGSVTSLCVISQGLGYTEEYVQ